MLQHIGASALTLNDPEHVSDQQHQSSTGGSDVAAQLLIDQGSWQHVRLMTSRYDDVDEVQYFPALLQQ